MFDSSVKIVHMEPTTNCNAACPQCMRTRVPFEPAELSIDDVKKILPINVVQQLEKIYMCGVYGDPASAKQTLEMYEYFKSINPNIVIGMNSNGGIRNTAWWQRLASIMTKDNDYVVFSIDGLEDTNHIYRKNVRWSKLIENANAFIAAGGNAHWDMLIFEHNKHQIDDSIKFAKKMGFNWFRAKISRRFNRFPVQGLSAPIEFIDKKTIDGPIECSAIAENSVYLNAHGRVYPCCWQEEAEYKTDVIKWINDLSNGWETNPDPICKKSCAKSESGTVFADQWRLVLDLKNNRLEN